MQLTEEQLNTWLVLLTLNLMVMSSILLEMMGGSINISDFTVEGEVKK